MKECPSCFRCWNDDVEICSYDEARLQVAFAGPPILDGKYRVDQRLGQGGMGVVYRAHHLGLQKTYAVKLIASFDQAFRARFRAEAETLGQLKHPNIVGVTDFGIDPRGSGLPYLVMEYLEGSTLADRYRRSGPLPPERWLQIFESIAQGIDHAHERGILHLDLKPGNVFVSDNESGRQTVKILDFGLARFVSDPPLEPSGSEWREEPMPKADAGGLDNHVREVAGKNRCPTCGSEREVGAIPDDPCPACLLRMGLVGDTPSGIDVSLRASAPLDDEGPTSSLGPLSERRCFGTMTYMAPEVLRGQHATRASDIYSFGILLYEVLVGRPPFQGSASEIGAGHCSGVAPPPTTLNASLPGEFDNALLSALERVPVRRPQRAIDVVRQIRSAVFRARVRTWREKEIPRRIALAAAAAVFLPLALAPVSRSRMLQQIENRSVDARFLALPKRAPDPRLILVSLDEASLDADPTPLTEKADDFGRELERVFEAGARGVAIDFLLPEAWSRSRAFSELILKHPDALTLAALSSPAGTVIGPECLSTLTAAALGPERASNLFAFVNLDEDPDGVTRRGRLSYLDQLGRERDTWARRAVRSLESSSLPSSSDGSGTGALLREATPGFWIDLSTDWQRFKRVSWKDLAATLEREADMFRGQLVLIGGDFVGFGGDYHRIPSEATQGVSGLVLQALIANTILSRFHVRDLAGFAFLSGTGLAVLVLMLTFLLNNRWLAPLLVVTLIPAYVGTSFLLFQRAQVLLPLAGPVLAVASAILLALVCRLALPAFPEYRTDGP